jgi:GNAT superfamily N-acetyltransferase
MAVTVRPLRRPDIPGVVEVRHLVWADEISTPASFAWRLDHPEPGEDARHWVATDGGQIVGFGFGARATWTEDAVARAFVGVRPERRGEGIGRRLFDAVDAYVERLDPLRTTTGTDQADERAARFVAHRGFRHTRDDQGWSIDPRVIDSGEFAGRREALESTGLRIVSMRALLDRPEVIYGLNLTLERDLPSDDPIASTYRSWLIHEFETPTFSPDASFAILDGDRPVAMTWIHLDLEGHRARHGMTGTLPAYRHQGLARLVKLASLRWLAEHGVTTLFTDNDTANVDMLALNDHLGFRPLTVWEFWVRDERSASAAGPGATGIRSPTPDRA